MTSITDPKLKRHIRQLYYLCDNFFTNSTEKRFITYIQEEIKIIGNHISSHYIYDTRLKTYINDLPKFNENDVELVDRSRKEKVVSLLYLFCAIPFAVGYFRFHSNLLDTIKDKAVYNDKRREKARSKVLADVALISNLTVGIIEKIK